MTFYLQSDAELPKKEKGKTFVPMYNRKIQKKKQTCFVCFPIRSTGFFPNVSSSFLSLNEDLKLGQIDEAAGPVGGLQLGDTCRGELGFPG